MKYISERVINAGECEEIIKSAYALSETLNHLLSEENLNMPDICKAAYILESLLKDIRDFEFVVERRTTIDYTHHD